MKNNQKDVTAEEFINKKKNQYKITDDKMKDAAGFAIIEAMMWDNAAQIIKEVNPQLTSQVCVNALFSVEMYLKSILLNMGVNVSEEKFGHDIYSMYCELDEKLKNDIKKDIQVDYEINRPLFNEVIHFNSFEEELKYIFNDFMYLRYEYEKFLNGKKIFTFTEFIMNIKNNVSQLAIKYNYEKKQN